MTRPLTRTAAALTAAAASLAAAQAAPAKPVSGKPLSSKEVTLYQADKCHMYFTATQAKQYKYACPDSHGKMRMVKVGSAEAQKQMSKTNAILSASKKAL